MSSKLDVWKVLELEGAKFCEQSMKTGSICSLTLLSLDGS